MAMSRRPWRSGNEYEGQASKHRNGGWQPVVRRHGGRGDGALREKNNTYSVFMDNIPVSMWAKWLFKIFSNYGVVLDAYIPNKRRRSTGSRFGFIRYNCPVAVDMALQKANRLWCDDKALKVKMAEFRKEYDKEQRKVQPLQQRRDKEDNQNVNATYQRRKSFADVVKGRVLQPSSIHTIKV
ncbi:hypothetical protein ACSBR2_025778 [Camellia fascicularis]